MPSPIPRPTRGPTRAAAALLLSVASLGSAACSSRPPASSAVSVAPLAPYSPEAAVLFDDVIAPPLFGFDPEGRNPAQDPKLKERTRQAEFVLAARVETVSRVGGVEHHGAYEVTLLPLGAPLVGDTVRDPVVLNVPATNPSYTWVDGAGVKWVGSRLLVFGRHYLDGGRPTLHFRCEPDTMAVRAAVERDAGLRLLR